MGRKIANVPPLLDMKVGIFAVCTFVWVLMPTRVLGFVGIVLCSGLLSGCRCASQNCIPSTAKVPCPGVPTLAATIVPDVTDVTAHVYRLPTPSEDYRLLDEFECQCTAAANGYLANMLRLEQHLAQVFAECETSKVRRNLYLQRNILALYTADKRGISASNAMVAFYYLAELETAVPYLDRIIQETEAASRRAHQLTDEDLAPEIDPTDLDRKVLELQSRRAELNLRRIELNGQLQRLLGCTLSEFEFFWPQVENEITVEPIDVEAAIAVGLTTRQDLRMIRLVMCNLDDETLPVVQRFLGAVDGALGTATVQDGLIHRLRCIACSDHEAPVRCRQLRILLDDAERAATVQIRLAAYEAQSHYQQIAIAREKIESWRTRLEVLKAKRGIDETTVFDESAAQNELYQAEIDLVHRVTQLRLARLALRHAQGLLPGECGFEPVLCCPPCDNGLRCCPLD